MNYEIPEVAEFTEEIEKLETSTPGHAKFFNAIYEKIFHNTLFLRAKTAVLESEIAKSIAIALGRNQALVFNTYDDMAAWFSDAANAENVAGLANGTNLYIIAKDVPDYWWSSVHQKYYELETQKVDLTKYDNIIGDTDISDIGDGTLTSGVKALNNNLGEINSNINGNILTYDESEDAYYIQHGADAVRKKLGDLQDELTLTIPTHIWVYGEQKESANIMIKISQIDGVYKAIIVSAGNTRLHHLPTGDVGFLAASALVNK